MSINIGVLGSCISRDSFNSKFNKNYSDFFKVVISAGRTSFISLMSNPLNIDEKEITILPESRQNFFRTRCLKMDFEKTLLSDLIEADIEYLIIDNYFEIIFGILYNEEYIITNNFWDLPDTKFGNTAVKKMNLLKMQNNPTEYFNLWIESCNNFFEYLHSNRPDLKIILNPARLATHALRENGDIDENRYHKKASVLNRILSELDKYIIENFDVYLMDFNENTIADDNHIWGPAEVHYEKAYYQNFLENLKSIVKLDYFLNNKKNPFNNNQFTEQDILPLIKDLNRLKKKNFILNYKSTYSGLKDKNINFDYGSEGNISLAILGNYIFSKPSNFIDLQSNKSSNIHLMNLKDNINLYITIYGRIGDYCEEEYNILLNTVKQDIKLNLISNNIFENENYLAYNILFSENNAYSSIYFIFKLNKTFRLSFKMNKPDINTFDIIDKIFKSLKSN